MIGIVITQVVPLYPRRVFLQWDVTSPTESGTYLFKVERCPSTQGPWDILAEDLENEFHFIDDLTTNTTYPEDGRPHPMSLTTNWYYRVTVTAPSSTTAVSEPHGITPELDAVAAGLRRKARYEESILFRKLNGVPLAILKRRRWGTRCPDCYDPVTRGIEREACPTCYGTSFVGGYWTPVQVYGRVNTPKNINAEKSPRDKEEGAMQVITLLDVPQLQDGDLIVELKTNNRHIVLKQTQTEIKRRSVHQQVVCSLIEHNGVEYDVPADLRVVAPLL